METRLYKCSLNRSDRIGKGSYSVVFKGFKKDDTNKTVAIKRIENDLDFFTENATKDINALRSVTGHKNVVKLLDLHSDDDYFYIIMEYCEGGDLEHFLTNRTPPSYEIRLDIMKQCARGVAYIHGLNPPVVHRDIKCNNILLQNTPAGVVVKIGDFGLAKVFDKIDADTNKIFMSTDAGSLAFRAPEMCTSGRKQYNASIDIYALGLVFTVLINYDDKDKLLEPHTANEPCDPYLPFGMRQLQAHTKKTMMPALFFKQVVDEKYPQIKSIITAMTRFDFNQRTDILRIKEQLKKECLEYAKQNAVADAMELMKSQHDKEMKEVNKRCSTLELQYSNEVQRRKQLEVELQKVYQSKHNAQTRQAEVNPITDLRHLAENSTSSHNQVLKTGADHVKPPRIRVIAADSSYSRFVGSESELKNDTKERVMVPDIQSDYKARDMKGDDGSRSTLPVVDYLRTYRHIRSGVLVKAIVGDITKLKVGAVVNAANEELKHYGGIAMAISKAGGRDIDDESKRYIRSHGKLSIAATCVTTAGRMPAKKVIHTVGPQWSHYRPEKCLKQLNDTFTNVLHTANKEKLKSVAIPAISAGIYGVPPTIVADTAITSITEYLGSNPASSVKHIVLVDIDDEMVQLFHGELDKQVNGGVYAVESQS